VTIRLLVVALAALALVPPDAIGSNARVPVPVPVADFGSTSLYLTGPRLAGSSIVWALRNSRGGIGVRRSTGTGPARTVANLPSPGGIAIVGLAASRHRIAVTEYGCINACIPDQITAARTLEGPLAGPLAHAVGCSPDSIPCGHAADCFEMPTADVWEHAVAIGSICGSPALVRDYSGGSGHTDLTLPPLRGVAIAGRYLAWRESPGPVSGKSDLVVYDRLAGHEAYRVTAPFAEFDLQEDGKVAFALPEPGESGRATVAWASADQPTPHVVGAGAWYPSVQMAADRIGVADGRAAGGGLRVLTLTGQVQARTVPEARVVGVSFDAARLAWASQPCADVHLLAWDLTKPRPPVVPRGACPAATVDQGRLAVGSDRRTALWVRCALRGALGCAGRLRLLADAGGTARYLIAAVLYQVHPGKRARLELRLTPEAARFLARHRSARVRATSIAFSRDDRGVSGTFEVRSRTLTLSP
jgi:hypothetical protein